MNSKAEAWKTVEGMFPTLKRNSRHTTMKPYCPCNTANLLDKVISLTNSGWAGYILMPQTESTKNTAESYKGNS